MAITITAGLPSLGAYAADHAILMYHRFGEDDYPSTNIKLEQFDAHLEILASGDYNVMALAIVIDRLQDGSHCQTDCRNHNRRCLSISHTEALPRLRAYDFPATVFGNAASRPQPSWVYELGPAARDADQQIGISVDPDTSTYAYNYA